MGLGIEDVVFLMGMKTFKTFIDTIERANPNLSDNLKKRYVTLMCRLWNKNYYNERIEDVEEEGPHF